MKHWRNRLVQSSTVFALLVVGGIAGYFGGKDFAQPVDQLEAASQYPLLSRRVLLKNAKDPLINFVSLREQLHNYFDTHELVGSLYFEYLPTGTEVRVQGDEKQTAASLLKVPLAMEVYKAHQLGLIDIDEMLILRADQLDSGFGSLYQKGAGYQLTIKDAVDIMLTTSDNTALKALSDRVDGLLPPQESVFRYLDIEIQQAEDLSVSVGARAYSSVLRCLYFACYVNRDGSQHILEALSKTSFNNRLAAGIQDKSITIAHKIGVFQETTQSDCGIIYVPDRPYILCVMIDGHNTEDTNRFIAELSKLAYDYVSGQ